MSEGCRPVDVPHNRGSSGFETSMLDRRRLSENDDSLGSVTCRSDYSLDSAMLQRDSTFSPAAVEDVLPDSGTTSRTLASVDTNVLLQTTENVVMAMEAARTNHLSHITPRDPSPPTRNDDVFSYKDVDYETETVDVGNTRVVPPQRSLLTKPPPPHAKSTTSYVRRGTKDAWANLSDYDIAADDVGTSSQKIHDRNRTVQLSQKRSTKVNFDR